ATGREPIAATARALSRRAREAIGSRYWDTQQQVWISGHTRNGQPRITRDSSAVVAVRSALFAPEQRRALLDQLASADFQTDWGTRSRPVSSPSYDPDSYASGSVWAIGTAGVADAFWAAHRPATALPVWTSLLPWFSLDSPGHVHETLAGNYFHEEQESVPEQTWSSAAFLTATVHGLLGLRVDGVAHRISFGPHLPPGWNALTARNVS